jgi:UDP-N-acetylmuramyl pentapeptide synthase
LAAAAAAAASELGISQDDVNNALNNRTGQVNTEVLAAR